jgi:hypothetical protein
MKRGAIKVSNFNSAATSWTIIHGRAVKKRRRHFHMHARRYIDIHTALGQFINPIILSAWGLRDCQFGREQATHSVRIKPQR